MNIQKIKIIAAFSVLFLLSTIVSAQSGGTFVIEKSVIAGGGGTAGGTLTATIRAQTLTGTYGL